MAIEGNEKSLEHLQSGLQILPKLKEGIAYDKTPVSQEESHSREFSSKEIEFSLLISFLLKHKKELKENNQLDRFLLPLLEGNKDKLNNLSAIDFKALKDLLKE